MSRPSFPIGHLVWILLFTPPVLAQRSPPQQTPEPPLADTPAAPPPPIQPASAPIEPGAIQPAVNWQQQPLAVPPAPASAQPLPRGTPAPPAAQAAPGPKASAPGVQLAVRTPPQQAQGKDLEIRLQIVNPHAIPARSVYLVYPLPAGAQLVKAEPPPTPAPNEGGYAWKFPTLAPGERKDVLVVIKPPPQLVDLDVTARVFVEQEQVARTRLIKPEIKLRKTGPEQAQRLDILIFGIEATNTSAVEVTDLVLTDELPPGLEHQPDELKDREHALPKEAMQISADRRTRSWKIERLAPRQTRRIEYHVASSAALAGTLEHKAVARAPGIAAEASSKVQLLETKLDLKVESSRKQSALHPARLRVVVTNRGSRVMQNLVVTDDTPDPCVFDAVSQGGQAFPSRVQWIVPSLAPGETRVLEAQVRKTEGGSVRHQVTAIYRGLTQKAEAISEFEAMAALDWEFQGSSAMVELNQEVTYELAIRNNGSAQAGNVRPTFTLPPEVRLVKAEPREHRVDGPRVTFDPTNLPPGGRALYRVRVKAVQSTLATRIQAEVASDAYPTGAVRRQEMLAVGASDPTITSTTVTGPPPRPVPTGNTPPPAAPPLNLNGAPSPSNTVPSRPPALPVMPPPPPVNSGGRPT